MPERGSRTGGWTGGRERAPAPAPTPRPAPGDAAPERLRRLLAILPAAHRRGDTTLGELAAELSMEADTIAEDLRTVADRAFDLPSEAGTDLQIDLEGDRVHVWTKGEFARPVRLSPREAVALALGLRLAALSPAAGGGERREALQRHLEAGLAATPPEDLARAFEAPELGADPETIRETLMDATRERRPCRIRYLKHGATEPEERDVHPYVTVHAEGRWYTLARCERAGDVRAFRLDRVLAAEVEEGTFEVADDFDPSRYFKDGSVFSGGAGAEAVVRYAPRVAAWAAETRPDGERRPDGSFIARHRVADPDWLVRHVLRHGGDAEVLAPAPLRRMVREAALRMAGSAR